MDRPIDNGDYLDSEAGKALLTTGPSSESPNGFPSSSTSEGHLTAMKSPDDPDPHSPTPPPAFQRLPEDLFIDIVQLYVDRRTPIRDLIRLILVCQRWRTTVEGTPTLWSRITGNETVAHLRKGLEMSQQSHLDIEYEGIGPNMTMRIFLSEIGPHIARWKSFVAILTTGELPLGELETKPAPVLEKLHLVNRYYRRWTISVTLFGGAPAPPTLKDLWISGIPISLHPLRLGQMERFKLQAHPHATTAEIITTLQGSPDLYKVELSCVGDRNELTLVKDTIRLPLLVDLRIHNIPQHMALQILSNIFAPNLRTLQVMLLGSENPRNRTLAAMTSLIPIMKSIASDALAINVHFGCILYRISIGGLSLAFEYNRNPMDAGELAAELFGWLGSHLGGHVMDHPVTLSINNFSTDSLCIDWLSSCVKVTKLRLWHDTTTTFTRLFKDALLSLSNPNALSSTGWLLPHVDILETNLTWKEASSNLVNMISARESAASHSNQPEGTPTMSPRRLREIRLSFGGFEANEEHPLEIDFMRAIRNAAVDADIYWSGVKWEE
ncbi:hypothetical protein FS837_001050 [Tulasnella sp. UAMH 9824]|nr:hypothetical protein FS837_001050 [Tulasnella sp. UAMH 9824]